MKRATRLIPLSREHQPALQVASRLRHAHSTDTVARAVEAALALKPALMSHFKVEETELIPELERFGETKLCARLRAEHETLVDFFASETRMTKHATNVGLLLDSHVRFEERELFPTLEAHWQREANSSADGAPTSTERFEVSSQTAGPDHGK